MDIYDRIRELNVVEGLSQREVAKLLGISRNTVRKYWAGKTLPGVTVERGTGAYLGFTFILRN